MISTFQGKMRSMCMKTGGTLWCPHNPTLNPRHTRAPAKVLWTRGTIHHPPTGNLALVLISAPTFLPHLHRGFPDSKVLRPQVPV